MPACLFCSRAIKNISEFCALNRISDIKNKIFIRLQHDCRTIYFILKKFERV